jgi:hypothetical protein
MYSHFQGAFYVRKTLIFNNVLGGTSDFKATNGWLRNFKARHGIEELEIHGELLCTKKENAEQNYEPTPSPREAFNCLEIEMKW